MKFNATYIRAIALTLEHAGEANAEELFNALFNAPTTRVVTGVHPAKTPQELLWDARKLVTPVTLAAYEIRSVNGRVGTPGIAGTNAVTWIKEARAYIGCGLKEAKDLHDFVRDNPTVANA